jgi:thiosulfate/3-mercaptopyruvate sulfurtransferase
MNLLISCEELQAIADDEAVCVVDCRFSLEDSEAGRAQYLAGHLPNAVFADLDKDLAAPVTAGTGRHPLPAPSEFAGTLGRLGISNSTRVIAYDQAGGALAARLWWMLRWAGHENASILDGGIARWQSLGLPLESGQEEPRPAEFEVTPDERRILQTSEIVAAGPDVHKLRLVDAREPGRYLGEIEPIDPVAGRIPGALNAPFATNLHENGTWKAPDELREQWNEVLEGDLISPWSVMCGSGVTACHHVVSALLAGLPEPRVYVGSWSEWIRDPARPVARGGASEA